MSRYRVSCYGYDYSLTPARPTGWRGTVANITIFATVMAVSAISGVVVTLELFASSSPSSVVVASATATPPPVRQASVQPVSQRIAQVFALVTTPTTAPKTVATVTPTPAPKTAPNNAPSTVSAAVTADHHLAPPATVAAAPVVKPTPVPPPAAVPAVKPQPTPVADSDLTFAKGYAQRQAVAHGAPIRHGKVIMEAKTQLGRTAVKAKPKTYARNTKTPNDQRRVATNQHPDAYGMFQRFERPDQFDFTHHQALAFGEQRTSRRTEAPRPPTSNGFFGGLF